MLPAPVGLLAAHFLSGHCDNHSYDPNPDLDTDPNPEH